MMNTNQFWQKAHDILTIHRIKHNHALITDDEKRETVTDYLSDMVSLMTEWHSSEDKPKK